MDSDDNFIPLSSPVASVLASIQARAALNDSDKIRAAARETNCPALIKHSAKRLVDFEKHAEESQWWA